MTTTSKASASFSLVPGLGDLLARIWAIACVASTMRSSMHLDLAARFLDAEEARLDHARVVENQQVTGCEQARQVGEAAVAKLAAANVQQAAAGAFDRRVLGDQFGRQGKVEVVDGQRHGEFASKQSKNGFPQGKPICVTGAGRQTRTLTPCGGGF